MASRFITPDGNNLGNNLVPYQWRPIAPDDNLELNDCVGIAIVDDTNRGDLSIRWHDGNITTLDLNQLHASTQDPANLIPMLPAFIMATNTDFGDGEILGAFLGPRWRVPNRPPEFRNTPRGSTNGMMENDKSERIVAPAAPSNTAFFECDVFDPDYDTLTWTEEGTWPTAFTLVTTGANAGRIGYVRSGDLDLGEISLEVGAIDASGNNVLVTQAFVIHVVS